MSSDVQSVYKALVVNNYISLIECIVVGYDYILLFPKEVEYVWRKRWTWVSTMYLLVRYPGLCWALLGGLSMFSGLGGDVKLTKFYVRSWYHIHSWPVKSTILFLVSCWTFPVFICAGDLVMILRVYTMWNRSRTILGVLLSFYALQVVVSVVLPAIYNSSPVYFIPTTMEVLDVTICTGSFIPSVPILLGVYSALPRFLVSAVLLIFAVAQTLKRLFEMYKATKQWQPNRYLNLFVRDGIFYFVVNTYYNVLVVATATPAINTPPVVTNVLLMVCTSLLGCTMPRFIISVREMFDRDLRGRWTGIDTGFGAVSQDFSGEKTTPSTIAFAGSQESRTLQEDDDEREDIPLETAGESSRRV